MDPRSFVAGYLVGKTLAVLAAVVLMVLAAHRPGLRFFRAAVFFTSLSVVWLVVLIGFVTDWIPVGLMANSGSGVYLLAALGTLLPAAALGTAIATLSSETK